MTREEYSRTLGYMEHLRLSSYEVETKAEYRRIMTEYRNLQNQIRPYAEGKAEFAATPANTEGSK